MHQSFKAWADEIPISEELAALEESLSMSALPGMDHLSDSLSLSEWSPHSKARIKTLADLDLSEASEEFCSELDRPDAALPAGVAAATGPSRKVTDIHAAPSAEKHDFQLPARQAAPPVSLPKGSPDSWHQGEWDHFVSDFIQKISAQVTAQVSATVAGEVSATVSASVTQSIAEAMKHSASANPISSRNETVATREEIDALLEENRTLSEEVRDLLADRGKLQITLDNRDAELSRFKHMFGALYMKA